MPGLTAFVDGMEGGAHRGRMSHRQQYEIHAVFDVHETRIHPARTYERSAAAKIIDDIPAQSHGARTIDGAGTNNRRRQAGVQRRPDAPLTGNFG